MTTEKRGVREVCAAASADARAARAYEAGAEGLNMTSVNLVADP
jgi:hypothetical protein